MIGVAPALAAEFTARGYSDNEVARLLGPMAHKGELRLVYSRPNGDLTTALPSSKHLYHVGKGFEAVAIADPPAPVDTTPIVISPDLREHANHDRVAVWARGADRLESSCRNAFQPDYQRLDVRGVGRCRSAEGCRRGAAVPEGARSGALADTPEAQEVAHADAWFDLSAAEWMPVALQLVRE